MSFAGRGRVSVRDVVTRLVPRRVARGGQVELAVDIKRSPAPTVSLPALAQRMRGL